MLSIDNMLPQFIFMEAPEPNTQIQQELVNSIIHGFGIIFGIVSIPILIAFAIKSNNSPGVIGAAIYGFCFLQLFTFSTLYHGFQHAKVKHVVSNP